MGNLQSNPSSSTQTTEKKYEVFLNFRGVDTRYGFTNYLYEALLRKSIETFRDEEKIPKGDQIGPVLLKAIRESKISVAIFSKEYASSKWCLRELVEIMECEKKNGQTVIPVFYKVAVHDVRHQEGGFKDGFDQLEKEFEENLEKEQVDSADVEKRRKEFYEEMQKWRQALEDASKLKGWHVKGLESEVIDKIVKDIWEKLMRTYKLSPCDFKGRLFGIEKRLKQVMSLLCLGNTDTRIIGIWGMGGIGKTTIADAIFHQISDDQYGKCFIQSVRQRLEQCGGLVSVLQQEVLSKVLNDRDIRLDSVTFPEDIKKRLRQKKVFIVLDDVDNFLKLEKLVGGLDGLGPGSRIVITTRNRDILHNCQVNDDYIYEVKRLSYEEAQKLFHEYAFKQSPLTKDLVKLSHEILQTINGNPLGLKVAGSSLRLNKLQWQSALSRLKKNSEILEVLQISYNGLEDEDKHAFLDIACFFVGEYEGYVAEILDNSYSLEVLSNRSLITISTNKIIQMHDLLQEMGRQIVCKEDLNNPSKRSRLWIQEDILDTLKNVAGTDEIRGIFLNMSQINEEHLSSQAFEKMTNLKFLKFYDSTFYEYLLSRSKLYCSNLSFSNGISYLSNKLRYLDWLGYPLKVLPSNFNPKYLRVLKLTFCDNLQSFPNEIRFPSLVSLDLSRCTNLARISDVLDAPSLEMINLYYCRNLLDFPRPAQHFNKLRNINLEGCSSLLYFPAPSPHCNNLYNIHFPSLNCLDFHWCIKLKVFPCISGNIEKLYMRKTAIHEVPSSVENLTELVELDLEKCTSLKHISSNIHKLKALRKLNLRNCSALECFPEISHPMGSLEILDLSGTAIKGLHHSIDKLTSVKYLWLSGCKNLEMLPISIYNLTSLVKLDLSCCPKLENLLGNSKTDLSNYGESATTKPPIFKLSNCELCFTNCPNLSKTAVNIMELQINQHRDMTIKGCGTQAVNLKLFYPESEVPGWFKRQTNGSSMNFQILGHDGVNGHLIGLAACAVIQFFDADARKRNAANKRIDDESYNEDWSVIRYFHKRIDDESYNEDSSVIPYFHKLIDEESYNEDSSVIRYFDKRIDDESYNEDDESYNEDEESYNEDSSVIRYFDKRIDDESYNEDSSVIRYFHSCQCEDENRLLNSFGNHVSISFILDPPTEANSDHVVLWYSNAFVSELCGKCTHYSFAFHIKEDDSICRVKHCGVCPIYEKHNIILPSIANWTCGAIDQDFGESSFKEQGKVRKYSDEAETSGRSNEDVIEPHPKRNCS